MLSFSQIMRALTILSLVTWGLSLFFTANDDAGIKKFSSMQEIKEFVGNVQNGYGTAKALAESSSDNAPEYSQTNVQVEGVDEGDIVKTDGKRIFTVSNERIVIVDAFPPESAKVSSIIEVNQSIGGIYINGGKIIVFGSVRYEYPVFREMDEKRLFAHVFFRPKSFIYVYDGSSLELKTNITFDGYIVNSRMVGEFVYTVSNAPINSETLELPSIIANGVRDDVLPDEVYHFTNPDSSYQFTEIISINVNQNSLKSKTVLTGSTSAIYASKENIYLTSQKYFDYLELQKRAFEEILIPSLPSSVRAEIRALSGEPWEKEQKAGEIVQRHVETLDDGDAWTKAYQEKYNSLYASMAKDSQKTIINKFSISQGRIDFKSQGMVAGHILNQFSMDEFDDNFRIATTTNNMDFGVISLARSAGPSGKAAAKTIDFQSETDISIVVEGNGIKIETSSSQLAAGENPVISESPITEPIAREPDTYNHLFVLNKNLEVIGKLENLAPNERIYSARFMGNRAYLVTFRQIDPLFAIDLSNPAEPKIAGELKIPGFSNYLHPYDENHIIGIGKEVEGSLAQGIKVGLFDVSDPANPKEVSKYEIGRRGTHSEALDDHKAFLLVKSKGILVIPTLLSEGDYKYSWQGAYVLDVSDGITLRGRITHVPGNESVEYYSYGPYSVKRSLYIGDYLYTISDRLIKVNGLADLGEVRSVELPYSREFYPILY